MKHSNHALHYLDLRPTPIERCEPHPLTVILGAFAFAALMYLLTFLAFCL
jgi:hypothetical protein